MGRSARNVQEPGTMRGIIWLQQGSKPSSHQSSSGTEEVEVNKGQVVRNKELRNRNSHGGSSSCCSD